MHYLCHYCNKSAYHSFYVKCCKKKCSKIFCQDCILNKFDKNFKPETVRPETWICYSCGDKCDCIHCDPRGLKRGNGSTSNRKTSMRLRLSGKMKWYHEKNRGALQTVSFEYPKPEELNNKKEIQETATKLKDKDKDDDNNNNSLLSINEKESKIEKRRAKKDLSFFENKYLIKKKALRECFKEQRVTEDERIEKRNENFNKLLCSFDLDGSKFLKITKNTFFSIFSNYKKLKSKFWKLRTNE